MTSIQPSAGGRLGAVATGEGDRRTRAAPATGALAAAALLIVACAPAAPAAIPPARAPMSAPGPNLAIPERMAAFVVDQKVGATDRWEIWRGTRWPAGTAAVGLYAKSEARFERLIAAHGAVISPKGSVLTLGATPYLFAAGGSVKLASALESASFSPDGGRILGIADGAWVLLDARDGREIARSEAKGSPSASTVVWRGDTLLVGEAGDYTVIRARDLATVLEHATGPLSPSGDRIADCAEPDYQGTRPKGSVALRVLDARTGKVLHTHRGEPPRYDRAGYRDVHWLPDGRRLAWVADGLHVLEVDRRRTVRVPLLSLGEGDAESTYRAAPTEDGARVCFMMDGREAIYDVARRALVRSRPGWAARCALVDYTAYIVEIPLGRGEAVVDLAPQGFGIWPDVALSADRSRAAVLVTDERVADKGARPVTLLIVDVATKRVLHRVALQPTWTADAELHVTDDGRAVDVTTFAESRRINFATGAAGPVQESPPPAPADARPPFAAIRAAPQIAGAAVLFHGSEGTFAARLDWQGPVLSWPSGACSAILSPHGNLALRRCGDRASIGAGATILSLLGDPPRGVASRGEGAAAVADDGSVVWADRDRLHVVTGGVARTLDPKPGGGLFTALAWSPDASLFAAFHAGSGVVYLVERESLAERWKKTAIRAYAVHEIRFSDDGRWVELDDGEEFPIEGIASTPAPPPLPDAGDGASRVHGVREPLDSGPPLRGAILAGGAIRVTARDHGAMRLHAQPSGETVATLIPHARGAIALFADGRVDWLGDPVAAPDFVCLRGDEVAPPERCAPLVDRGALARVAGAPR